ncbi:MAG TPA: sensor domain-containing protein [Pseudonocardiaceae bacterium]|nr:sensor domain-containing protein [Pseudonocardiaceae bacterium]
MATNERRAPNRVALAGWGFLFGLASVLVGTLLFSVLITLAGLAAVWVGIPMLLAVLPALRGFADLHRRWGGNVMDVPIARPYLPQPTGSLLTRALAYAKDPATRRDLLWSLLNPFVVCTLGVLPMGFLLGTVWYAIFPWLYSLVPAGLFDDNYGIFRVHNQATSYLQWIFVPISFGLFWFTTRPLMRTYARFNRRLLGPTDSAELALRVAQLTESRAETVDTQAAELRRIERDLHDGAQARLVSLGMSLGMAEELLGRDPIAAQSMLAEARESTGIALAELRDLVRGIHPPVLADRGLDGAVRALVLSVPMPVETTIELPGRLPAPVESAAYFAVAEALTNVIKHSGATSAWIVVRHDGTRLGMMVGDNGRGGAQANGGGGLHGLERRLAAFDGTMTVASPTGGPTIVTMELPCPTPSA